jgi:hypothetical protein
MRPTTIADVLHYVDELEEQYHREQKQAIMQRSMDKAISALAGQEACERLRRWLEMRTEMATNFAVVQGKRGRA